MDTRIKIARPFLALTANTSPLDRQFARARTFLLFALVVILGALFVLFGLHLTKDVPFSDLMRDTAAVNNQSPYIGLFSNLGIIGWLAGGVTWILHAFLLGTLQRPRAQFSFWAGICTFGLMIDDAMMLHDELFPHVLHIPEKLVLLVYAGSAMLFLFYWGRYILSHDFVLCALAAIGLVGSLAADFILPFSEMELVFEDGLKFAGIVFWGFYALQMFLRTAHELRENDPYVQQAQAATTTATATAD